MSDQATILPEQTIRYTMDNLGLIRSSEVVNAGDLGRYLGPAPFGGWHYTEPAKYPGKICPVGREMFEVAK